MFEYYDRDDVYLADTTKEIAEDMKVVPSRGEKAMAFDALGTIYETNGTNWIKFSDSSVLAYYTLALTVGANTNLSVVSAVDGHEYHSGDRIYAGTELTVTATAATGHTLSTFTINAGNVTSPATHTASANVTIETAATINEYTLTKTEGANTTLTIMDGETELENAADVEYGTVLTVTASAAEGYELTTFTIGGEDSLGTNPATVTMTDDLTIETAAT
jgi:hypothetical protein